MCCSPQKVAQAHCPQLLSVGRPYVAFPGEIEESWVRVAWETRPEEGAESVHKDFNGIKERYANMPNSAAVYCKSTTCGGPHRFKKPLPKRRKNECH